jgi:hypothetical protein
LRFALLAVYLGDGLGVYGYSIPLRFKILFFLHSKILKRKIAKKTSAKGNYFLVSREAFQYAPWPM